MKSTEQPSEEDVAGTLFVAALVVITLSLYFLVAPKHTEPIPEEVNRVQFNECLADNYKTYRRAVYQICEERAIRLLRADVSDIPRSDASVVLAGSGVSR